MLHCEMDIPEFDAFITHIPLYLDYRPYEFMRLLTETDEEGSTEDE